MQYLLKQHLVTLCLLLAIPAGASAASEYEIRLPDGSTWRGSTGDQVSVISLEQGIEVTFTGRLNVVKDLWIQVEGNIAGELRRKTIFRGDIVDMSMAGGAGDVDTDLDRRQPSGADVADPGAAADQGRGVFLVELKGMVGGPFRHQEIEMIGEHADQFGEGQIIVLLLDSNGGLVVESERINETIYDLKDRGHRVVAWIRKAISAGCSTAMACNEIYFMTEGAAGSVTTLGGGGSISEEDNPHVMDHLLETAEKGGYSEHIARSMKLNKYMSAYWKDPETGEVIFYGGKDGQWHKELPEGAVILSDEKSNLTFTHDVAYDCGFSQGTADTEDELAVLLDLGSWREIDGYGRRISEEWQTYWDRMEREVARLMVELQIKNSGLGDPEVKLLTEIKILKKILRLVREYPLLMAMNNIGAEPEDIEKAIEEKEYQLRQMRRNRG